MTNAALIAALSLVVPLAVPDGPNPDRVTGVEEPAREEGAVVREVANAVLFVPRITVDYMFRGVEAAANIVADEQIVPRYRRLLGIPEGGEFYVFPTLFAETGSAFNVGLRMIANTRHVTTSQRFGFGGVDDWVIESRVLIDGEQSFPFALSLEALGQSRDGLEYRGLGAIPGVDERNAFLPSQEGQVGHYREVRSRLIGSLGLRLAPELELFLSTSVQRRQIDDDPDEGAPLSQVFAPLPGVERPSWIGYHELAARFDSRATRGRPVPGVFLEGYVGGARSVVGPPVSFVRVGWRLASFISVYRRTNVLGGKVVFDRIVPLGGVPVPFHEVPRQPEFRGLYDRADHVSVVGSVDYTWLLAPVLGMRTFVDGAVAAPSVSKLSFDALQRVRIAAGIGLDLFSESARIAELALSGSSDGPRVLLSFGSPNGYGDRQHRD